MVLTTENHKSLNAASLSSTHPTGMPHIDQFNSQALSKSLFASTPYFDLFVEKNKAIELDAAEYSLQIIY